MKQRKYLVLFSLASYEKKHGVNFLSGKEVLSPHSSQKFNHHCCCIVSSRSLDSLFDEMLC